MQRKYLPAIFVLVLLLNQAFIINAQAENGTQIKNENKMKSEEFDHPKQIRQVFVIVAPGLSATSVNRYELPAIAAIAKSGTISNGAIPSLTKSLQEDFTLMISGEDSTAIADVKQTDKTIFTKLAGWGRSSLVVDVAGVMQPKTQGTKVVKLNQEKELNKIFEEFMSQVDDAKPYLSMLILPDGSPKTEHFQYKLDQEMSRLVRKLGDKGIYDESLITIIGLNNRKQKGTTGSDLVPFIIKGPKVKEGNKIHTVQLKDVLPTIEYLTTGQQLPDRNAIIWNVIVRENQYTELQLLRKMINDLGAGNLSEYRRSSKLNEEILSFRTEKQHIDEKQKLAQQTIFTKSQQISELRSRIQIHKYIEFALIILIIAGAIIEYRILRKKFLMF